MPMIPRKLTKYHISLPMQAGKCVVANNPEIAARVYFPDHNLVVHSTGKGWVRFKSENDFPKGWPHNMEGGGGGKILDVEDTGPILVVDSE